MSLCSIKNCKNPSGKLHKYPRNSEIRKKWVAVSNITKVPFERLPYSSSKVCSNHFTDSQYTNTLKKYLNKTAVPTLNIPSQTVSTDASVPVLSTKSNSSIPHRSVLTPIVITNSIVPCLNDVSETISTYSKQILDEHNYFNNDYMELPLHQSVTSELVSEKLQIFDKMETATTNIICNSYSVPPTNTLQVVSISSEQISQVFGKDNSSSFYSKPLQECFIQKPIQECKIIDNINSTNIFTNCDSNSQNITSAGSQTIHIFEKISPIMKNASTSTITTRKPLLNRYNSLRRKYRYASKRLKELQIQIKHFKTMEKMRTKYNSHIVEAQEEFEKFQLKNAMKKPGGERYSHEQKCMALAIYKNSPKSYSFLKKLFSLPSRQTIASFGRAN